jgi:putative hydrolase of the HAD superfamily
LSYKYLILDLDETLYPKQSGLLQCLDRRIEDFMRQNLDLPVETLTTLRSKYFHKYGTTLSGMIINHGVNPAEYIKYVFQVNPADYIQPDPQLAILLNEISLEKVVFSNSPLNYVENVLDVLGIHEQFRKVYDIGFSDFMGKPNLASFRKVLGDLKIDGDSCIMVDDSLVNVLGAKKAGLTGVWLSEALNPNIDWVIQNIYELKKLIPELMQGKIPA